MGLVFAVGGFFLFAVCPKRPATSRTLGDQSCDQRNGFGTAQTGGRDPLSFCEEGKTIRGLESVAAHSGTHLATERRRCMSVPGE